MRKIATILLLLSSVAWAGDAPPELWSWFKDLNKSQEACELQSAFALQELSLENQTENQYGIYGTIKSNRVVVKCIRMSDDQSKLMVAVAGHDRDSVAFVRNKIIGAIR